MPAPTRPGKRQVSGVILSVRVTTQEAELLKVMAEQHRVTVSEYVRRSALEDRPFRAKTGRPSYIRTVNRA